MEAEKSILIVDDEVGIRSLLFDVLSEEGFKVSLAKDGGESLAQMREKHFDLLITDVNMPGIGGLELLKKMKEAGRRERVIVMSGEPIRESDLGDEFHPVYRLLQKPFPIQGFLKVVFSALAKSSRKAREGTRANPKGIQGCSIN